MNKLKETLSASLGVFGTILWFLITILLTLAPIICVLDFSFIVDLLIIIAITALPLIGAIIELGLWVWSFIVAFGMPFDVFMLIYYIALVIYVVTKVIPMIAAIFGSKK